MGREARRSYDLEQVEIVPSRRTRSSQEVSTAWQLDAYPFAIPLVTHPSDAVVSPASAVRIGQLGGLAVLNAEGLWARHADADGALARVVAAASDDPGSAVGLLQELHAVPIDTALLTEALKRVREAGVTVAARVSPQRARELTPDLLAAGVEVLVVQARSSRPSTYRAVSRSTSRTSSPRSTSRSSRGAAATTAPPCTSCAPAPQA
jgi:IMP dehydrogenase